MTITLRGTKGSALTHSELDGNFTDLVGRAPPAAGATGTVLKKLSNADYDFGWATDEDSGSASLPWYDVKAYGAKGDDTRIAAAAATTAGSTSVTVTGASFVAGDVGKWVYIPGAGLGAGANVVADAGNTTTSFKTSYSSDDEGRYAGQILRFAPTCATTALRNLERTVTAYAGSTRVVTVDTALPATPTTGDSFELVAGHAAQVASVTDGDTIVLSVAADRAVTGADFWYYTDDSAAFAAAIAAINASGHPGRLVVPQPTGLSYRIAEVQIVALVDIEVVGVGMVRLKKIDNRIATVGAGSGQQKARMWWVSHNNPAYETRRRYTPWVTTRNLILDGNRGHQVDADGMQWTGDYYLQYDTCAYVDGIGDSLLKTPATFIDCEFVETTGDGVGLGKNCRVEMVRCRTFNCFRGGVVNLGFTNELIATDCETDDDLLVTPSNFSGLMWEQENYSAAVPNTGVVIIDGWIFRQGSINLAPWGYIGGQTTAVDDTSLYILNRIVVDKGNQTDQVQIEMLGQGTILVSDSVFYGGRMANLGVDPYGRNAANGFCARTCFAGNVEITNTRFVASNNGLPVTDPAPTFYAALRVWDTNDNNRAAAKVRLKGCTFAMDETCHASAPVYAIFDEEMDVRWSMNVIAGGTPPPYLELTDCSFEPLAYFTDIATPSGYTVRLFDWLYYGQEGQNMIARDCGGVGKSGFRFNPTRSKPAYAQFAGGDYILSGPLIDINPPLGAPDLDAVIWFRDFHQDCRYNDLAGGNYGNLQTYNGRTIYVDSDPTAAGPVAVTGRALYQGIRYHDRYMGRLEHGGITPGSVSFVRALFADSFTTTFTITDSNNGDGTGDLLEGATVVGTIVYATGWYDFSWNTEQTDLNDRVLADYTHANDTPGFLGDVAVLKGNPATRWRCTAASATDATWTAL